MKREKTVPASLNTAVAFLREGKPQQWKYVQYTVHITMPWLLLFQSVFKFILKFSCSALSCGKISKVTLTRSLSERAFIFLEVLFFRFIFYFF